MLAIKVITAAFGCFLCAVGLVTLGLGSIRKPAIEVIAQKRALLIAPTIILIGDSNTLAGQPWGSRLSRDPFSALTIARGGFMVWQLFLLTDTTKWKRKPKFISYMAGTNDAGTDRITDEQSLSDQMANIDQLVASGSKVIVTLIPPHTEPARSLRTLGMNMALKAALVDRPVAIIDLWPELAENGILQGRYRKDETHFNEAALTIWTKHLRAAMI